MKVAHVLFLIIGNLEAAVTYAICEGPQLAQSSANECTSTKRMYGTMINKKSDHICLMIWFCFFPPPIPQLSRHTYRYLDNQSYMM